MSTYWKNMAKSIGYAALTGFYGLVTVIVAKRALDYRECAFASANDIKVKIDVTGSPAMADAVNRAASEAACAKMAELTGGARNGKESTPNKG